MNRYKSVSYRRAFVVIATPVLLFIVCIGSMFAGVILSPWWFILTGVSAVATLVAVAWMIQVADREIPVRNM